MRLFNLNDEEVAHIQALRSLPNVQRLGLMAVARQLSLPAGGYPRLCTAKVVAIKPSSRRVGERS